MKLENITQCVTQAPRRRFADACGLAHGLDLVGERWALLVIRELLLGPRRFSDIRTALPGISANVLTQRLTELEARHIIERIRLPPPASARLYGLTPWGLEAEPMVLAMAKWAYRSPDHDRMLPLTGVAMLLSLRINLDRGKAGAMALNLAFEIDGTPYHATLADGQLSPKAGARADSASAPDLAYRGTARGLAARIYGKAPPADLAAADVLHFSGDPALETRFAALFALPPRYEPPEKSSTPAG